MSKSDTQKTLILFSGEGEEERCDSEYPAQIDELINSQTLDSGQKGKRLRYATSRDTELNWRGRNKMLNQQNCCKLG